MQEQQKITKIPFWRSLRLKFALSYVALIVAVLGLLNSYPIFVSQDMVFKAKLTSLQNQAAVIASTVASMEELTREGVTQVMEVLDESSMNRVLITDQNGLILYDSDSGQAGRSDEHRYAMMQELVLALEGSDVFQSTYSAGAFRSSGAVPIQYRNATIGGVYLYEYDSEQGAIITGLQQNLMRISLLLLAMALLISVFLSRTMTRPISRLTAGISELRQGEYSTRVEVSGRDELAMLATAFNDMTERLEKTDAMRRRFVSDASHELKTPLASIKLLTDSIAQNTDMDAETIRDFVQDIGTEADRLVRITEKLLALTRMDNATHKQASRSSVDLTDVISDALHMLTPLANQRNISIHLILAENCVVMASADEMYQVIFNLVENAIKYNVDDGKIWLRVRRSADSVFLIVEDTGIGIPQEDRTRIFERFYRVDKARSREAGGTGLGLSIVHDTVVANGGAIRVDARPEGGTVFIVQLPLARGGKTEGESGT